MATGTKKGYFRTAITLGNDLARFLDTEAVGRVGKGAVAVHALFPAAKNILVALLALLISHQVFGRYQRIAGNFEIGWREIMRLRDAGIFFCQHMYRQHDGCKTSGESQPAISEMIANRAASKPVQYK